MRRLRRFFQQLRSWRKTQEYEERLQAEIEEHLALQTAENVRTGLSPVEARRQAVLKFGAAEAIKEEYRDRKGFPFFETLWQDVRYTLRRLRKTPTFTLTTVLLLALGIGATTSIFTLVYAALLKSLAVANPEALYRLGKQAQCCNWSGYSQTNEWSMISYDLYMHFRDHTNGFAELAAFQASESPFGVRRSGDSEPAQSYEGEFVSGNYFVMFGLQAYAGRLLTPRDDGPGAPATTVMSYRLWQQRYRSDPSIIGSVFDIDGKPFTLIGIAPPAFFGDRLRNNPPDFYLPLSIEPAMEANANLNRPDTSWLDVIGRIKPGVNPISLEAQMRVELKRWLRSHWSDMSANDRAIFSEQTLFLRPGGAGITSMREQYEHWLQILMLVSGFALLIVCANVANLMLVRGMERQQQISLSMALGAQALRLVRQALTESILLSLLGGAAGLATAFAGTRLLLHFAFPTQNGAAGIPINALPSGPVLLFAFAVSFLTGIAFGLAPASMAARANPMDALRGASRTLSLTINARTGSLLRKTLVVSQAALSLVLLSASGLLTVVLYRLETQNLGVDQDHRLVATSNPRLAGYHPDQLTPLYRHIRDTLTSIPGVSAVALCSYAPLNVNAWGADIWIEGHPPPGPGDNNFAILERVTGGYFAAIGTPIVRGRGISEGDTAASQHVAVINEAFARKFFRHEDPLGKYFGRWVGGAGQYQIVGIAKDAHYWMSDLGKSPTPGIFLPESQHDFRPNAGAVEVSPGTHFLNDIVLVSRPGVTISSDQIRKALASVDPNLPIISIQMLSERVAGQFVPQRLMARLTSCFGLLSLILASIGLYGVTAYNATQRINEIGLRMALGAGHGDVISLVLRGAFGLIVLGLLVGLPLTLAAGRFLGSQLYGMNPYDPMVISVSAIALGLSALVASLIPAFRASSISPIEALRPE